MVKNIPNRKTIEDFSEKIDEARFGQTIQFLSPADENVVCVVGPYELFA